MNRAKVSRETIDFQDAVWDYMLEHCDISKSGIMFVKFHTKNKRQFLGHVQSRVDGYHREDVSKKQELLDNNDLTFKQTKVNKKESYKTNKKNRFEMIKKVERFNRLPNWVKKIIITCQKLESNLKAIYLSQKK